MTNRELDQVINERKEILKQSFSPESMSLLDEEWLEREACSSAITLNLAIVVYDSMKIYPDKVKIQELADICSVPANSVYTILSALSIENACDINEAIHQICMLRCKTK